MIHKAQMMVAAPISGEARSTTRRIVNFAGYVRELGTEVSEVTICDLSTDGCSLETDLALEQGTEVWLKIRGFTARRARVVWTAEGGAGFEFVVPIRQEHLEEVLASTRKPALRFGT